MHVPYFRFGGTGRLFGGHKQHAHPTFPEHCAACRYGAQSAWEKIREKPAGMVTVALAVDRSSVPVNGVDTAEMAGLVSLTTRMSMVVPTGTFSACSSMVIGWAVSSWISAGLNEPVGRAGTGWPSIVRMRIVATGAVGSRIGSGSRVVERASPLSVPVKVFWVVSIGLGPGPGSRKGPLR